MLSDSSITYHTVTLGALTHEGHALAEVILQDEAGESHTHLLAVPAGLPGERVTIAVEIPAPRAGRRRRRGKKRPPRVWITEIQQPSPLRVEAHCPIFGICGGCQLQHMSYRAQLEWKHGIVQQLLHDIGGFEDPPLLAPVPCDDPWHYRNHMRFSINREGQPGLTARGSHRVLPLTNCPIAHEKINRILNILSQQNNPRPQALIRCSTANQQMLIQPMQNEQITQQLTKAELEVCTETMEEVLGGETFRIRPSSFFQTNTAQAEKMAQMVLDGIIGPAITQEREMTVVDAYCGVGTFALLLARHVKKVIAIEESASAIKDAQWNTRDVSNIEILKGKVEDILLSLNLPIDGFVIDPPRAGCQRTVLDTLIQHPVQRIVYVSCNPETLARDLRILCHEHQAYQLNSVQPLDMFPQTAHIECIATLECAQCQGRDTGIQIQCSDSSRAQ